MLHKQVADQIRTAIYSFPTVEIEFDTYTHVGYDSPNICIYVDWYLEVFFKLEFYEDTKIRLEKGKTNRLFEMHWTHLL